MKKQILKDFELTEISGVDRPAQPTAKATIIKREIPSEDISDIGREGINADSDKDPADLPDVLLDKTSGMEDDDMSELDDLKTQVADLTKKLEESEAIAKMSDDEKMYMAKMSPEDKAKFMSMSAEERKKKMGMMKRDDESIEVAGQTVNKSVVGDAMFEILKAQDAQLKANQEAIAKAQEDALMATLSKRADAEFAHIPGKSEEIAGVLKYAATMPENVKATFESIMKSAEEMASKAFEKRGIKTGDDVEKSATDKVDTLAKAYAAEKNVDYASAYAHVLNANPDLYNEMQKEGK